MTECTGSRYWRKRIGEAKERYNKWSRGRAPHGAPAAQWMAWVAWRRRRIEYFNEEVANRSWHNQQSK